MLLCFQVTSPHRTDGQDRAEPFGVTKIDWFVEWPCRCRWRAEWLVPSIC